MARKGKRVRDRRARELGDAQAGSNGRGDDRGNPNPLEHATPDEELAEAQMALGRPELAHTPEEELADEQELEREAAASVVPAAGSAPAQRQRGGNRLINFAQGSWRELQRVQWPDRRQVMQATGVVLGFVIVAGVFLGAADYVAQKLVNFILK